MEVVVITGAKDDGGGADTGAKDDGVGGDNWS